MKKKLKANLWKLSIMKALWSFHLIMPIIVLFYQDNGLGIGDVFLLQAIYAILIVVFEVPSGYIADILGRKQSMIMGGICWAIGFFVYAGGASFEMFLIAEVLFGLGASFVSGADSALLYDTLLELKKDKEFKKYEGKILFYANTAEGVASVLGGLLAVISLRFPFIVQAPIMVIPLLLSFSLFEPVRHKLDTSAGKFKQVLKIVKYALHEHLEIKWLIIYAGLVNVSTLVMVWFVQPYLQDVLLPLALFGIVWAILRFTVGGFSMFAHNIEEKLGRKNTLVSLIVISSITYLLLGFFYTLWAGVFLLLHSLVRGLTNPVLKDYVNKVIASDIRATVLSVKNLFVRLLYIIIGPAIGYVSDAYSLQAAFYLLGIGFLTFGSIALLFMRKHEVL